MATALATKSSGNIRPSFLAAKAERIRALMIEWTKNALELGKELKAARGSFETQSEWEKWLDKEIGISRSHAGTLMQIAKKFADAPAKLSTSFQVLSYIVREHVPEEGRKEVVERIRRGEKITKPSARKIVDSHRPKPKEANRIAKETGKPTLASDGYLYLGASKEQTKETEERRTVVYAVRRAVETLATIETTPHQFLKLAQPHQLWNEKEEQQIAGALKWLNALYAAWGHRE